MGINIKLFAYFIIFILFVIPVFGGWVPSFCNDNLCDLNSLSAEYDCSNCENFGDCTQWQCRGFIDTFIPNTIYPMVAYLEKTEVLDDIASSTYIQNSEIGKYNRFGSPKDIKDGNGNIKLLNYSFCGLYSEENDFFVLNKVNYNPINCMVIHITDSNNQKIEYYYDDFFRLVKVVNPFDTELSPSLRYIYNIKNPLNDGLNITIISKINETTFSESTVFKDAMGRTYRGKKENDDQDIISDIWYNGAGLEEDAFSPHYQGESIGPLGVVPYVKIEYYNDPLLRVKKLYPEALFSSSVFIETLYGNENGMFKTQVKDEEGHYVKSLTDVYGNLKEMHEGSDDGVSFDYTTSYGYDTLGNILTITDAAGRVSDISNYDDRGRLTTNIHIDTGTKQIWYDNNNNIKVVEDENCQVYYVYDNLNRLINVGVLNE